MRLKNTTDLPDYFIRRVISWCCKEAELPVSWLREITVDPSRVSYWFYAKGIDSFRILIGGADKFPVGPFRWNRSTLKVCATRCDGLLFAAAFQIYRCKFFFDRDQEVQTVSPQDYETANSVWFANYMLDLSQKQSCRMITMLKPPARLLKTKPPRPTKAELNEKHDRMLLGKWSRKLSLAKTKVQIYATKVHHHELRKCRLDEISVSSQSVVPGD